ncbi:MAG: UDP-2,3-diacylglucosamine diphosphatase [Chitinophagales bacterium]
MSVSKNIYFASDLHLGTPNYKQSLQREKEFIKWLNQIKDDCEELFLVGDIFDFWFDYAQVVPKGYTRLFGKLAEFTDSGIKVHYFKGNHDMWLSGYFEHELGFEIHSDNYTFEKNGIKFLVGHGDGKGPKDYKYKILKKVFRNPACHFLFKWLHPDIGMAIANYFSKKSRYGNGETEEKFLGADKEWLIQYIKRKETQNHFDYYIFGHRHLALEYKINENTTYINLGDWLRFKSYAVFDGQKTTLCYFNT